LGHGLDYRGLSKFRQGNFYDSIKIVNRSLITGGRGYSARTKLLPKLYHNRYLVHSMENPL